MRGLTVCAMVGLMSAMMLIGCSAAPDAVAPAAKHEPLLVFLVRHGEKVPISRNPDLSAAGQARAAALAATLHSVSIEHVHSSDFIRTRDTAAPAAADHGLQVELYDHQDLPSLAGRLRNEGGVHLVVGHSDTTPRMVELLGGEPGPPIDTAGEYDRLYIVAIGSDGAATSVLMRYGRSYTPEETP